jgi:hypothetical protein
LVKVGVVAIDGTKMSANASQERNHGYERIAREILAEAARIDAEEDELYGDARGDELPEHLRTAEGRKAALREAKRQLDAERAERLEEDTGAGEDEAGSEGSGVPLVLDPAAIVTHSSGQRKWLQVARRPDPTRSPAIAGDPTHRRAHPPFPVTGPTTVCPTATA